MPWRWNGLQQSLVNNILQCQWQTKGIVTKVIPQLFLAEHGILLCDSSFRADAAHDGMANALVVCFKCQSESMHKQGTHIVACCSAHRHYQPAVDLIPEGKPDAGCQPTTLLYPKLNHARL